MDNLEEEKIIETEDNEKIYLEEIEEICIKTHLY